LGKLSSIEELFAGRHFDREVIILCVRWYLRFKLSVRDLVEMMAERGLDLAHTTILRWVRRYVPEFIKRWNRFGKAAGRSWRVDETYIKVRGQWTYLYRAIDKAGQTVVEVSEQPDRTRPQRHQVQNPPHVRIQELLLCCDHHCRSGTASSYSQGSILPQPPPPQRPSCACTLECGVRCLI